MSIYSVEFTIHAKGDPNTWICWEIDGLKVNYPLTVGMQLSMHSLGYDRICTIREVHPHIRVYHDPDSGIPLLDDTGSDLIVVRLADVEAEWLDTDSPHDLVEKDKEMRNIGWSFVEATEQWDTWIKQAYADYDAD